MASFFRLVARRNYEEITAEGWVKNSGDREKTQQDKLKPPHLLPYPPGMRRLVGTHGDISVIIPA